MVELIGILEPGWDHKLENRVWRQLAGAYGARLTLVHRDYETMEEALEASSYPLVFVVPPGRTDSIEFTDLPAQEDTSYVFGNVNDSLVSYIDEESTVVHLTTPTKCDMFAISVAGTVLYEHR